jgi:hypothetical protein
LKNTALWSLELAAWNKSKKRRRRLFAVVNISPIIPEMKILDISLTKDSRHLLHAIHSPIYWRILKKILLFSGFKNPDKKKSAKQEN